MSSKPFVHLHTHSHYSLLNALPKVPDLVAAAQTFEMPALALTDNGNLYGAIEFYKACKEAGIKPILGIDAYVAARTRHDKEPGIDNRRSRLVLLAKDLAGYKNLLKLVTDSHLEGFYYKPRVDRELLEKYSEGLIALIPSFSGEIIQALKSHDPERAPEVLAWYQKTFGKENVYLELSHHPEIEGHQSAQEHIKTFATKMGAPLAAAHDVYYLKPEDRRAREIMVKIQSGTTMEDGDGTEDFSFVSTEDAYRYFKDTPEALENTLKIADACNLELPLGQWAFPIPDIPSGKTADEELYALAVVGIERRGLHQTPDVMERLTYELDIIKQKGYASYFIIVADLLRYANEKKIFTNIRGSVAGSLTTYLTGITKVNPLEYKIPFERFLNPERPSAPDIDMDYADNRRDEMLDYARQKYGSDKVAQIGTFGTMMARAAVRDVARALGHPYSTGDQIAKLIPMGSQGFPMTIEKALEMEPELKNLYKKESVAKEVIDLARKIEGCVRHISVHAAGVVIAPRPLTEFTPLQFDPKGGKMITQYDMYSIDENNVGLLKFDFLGIKNLAILADAVRRVKETRNIDIDIETVPLDDKKTFEMLSRGETLGLFQLNGSGMTRFLKDLRPSSILDINAMVALYRPGPMESIPEYIERKHNTHTVSYLDPRLKEILSQSYGIVTYQDDVLLIAITLAGYSWLKADTLRKAMGKKIPEIMAAEKEKLIKGFIEYGKLPPQKAERLWKLIEPFAAYGFGKAHAASYGLVAYQTAYMKANYPGEYMAAVLTADAGNVDEIAVSIAECQRMKIPVLPPDVNESAGDFTVILEADGSQKIRFGLYSIKNFGEGIADVIIAERTEHGRFTSLADFLARIKNRNLNKKSLEALIKCGALDAFGERGSMLTNMDTLLLYNREHGESSSNQDSLFGSLPTVNTLRLMDAPEATQSDRLLWEKELLGLYVSGHPLDQFKEKLAKRQGTINQMKEHSREGITAIIAGIVEESKPIFTKSGDKMAFVRIADYDGSIEAVIFPKTLIQYADLLQPQKCIALKGKFSGRNGEKSLIVEAVKAL